MVSLKSVLYCNAAQSLLKLELYRRALEASTECLKLDANNVKALHRRSQAHEALREYKEACNDAISVQKLGGGSLSKDEINKRVAHLQAKQAAVEQEAEESEDDDDMELVKMKQRFDEIVEKYDLREDGAADQVADWLTSGEWSVTVKRVAQRWKMEEVDAMDFLAWIAKGLEFQKQNAENASQVQGSSPAPDLIDN